MATAPPMPKSFEDARLRHLEVEKELERICSGVHFRTSKRACEFLRYVVRVTLDGRLDSLKERSIGIDLLGRDVSYDPSSDAIVRVRANDVRKRLSSYYASTTMASELQINLPTGTYVPCFVPGGPVRGETETSLVPITVAQPQELVRSVPPLSRLALMRPALLALLLCILLIRHRLEDRESYLRFWDHILSGRNTLLLSIDSQEKSKLAFSMYPIAWIAGRYGVDTAIEDSIPSEPNPENLASVQESSVTPPDIAKDPRLRWILVLQAGQNCIIDRLPDSLSIAGAPSAAVLTILPEHAAMLHIQGTDSEAIGHLLEELTSQKSFPEDVIDQLDNRHILQVLLQRSVTGQWQTRIFSGVS